MHPVLRQIVELGIIRQTDLAELAQRADTVSDSLELQLDLLVQAGTLTPLQARRIVDCGPPSLVLGNYLIRDRVGSGGMGDVYEAIHQRLNRRVALKVLKPELTRDDNAVRRFRREVEASARMAHPNIVTVTDAGQADGHHFYVMEFVDGVDLASLVKTCGPLDLPFAVEIGRQVADGMDFVHRQNVIHRDLKPSNLLLDRGGMVAILDLGLARFFQAEAGTTSETQLTLTGNVMGTIDYMAPEQALDTRTADERADIYALGCTIYYLLTGKPLFPESTMMKRLLAHREQPIPSLDDVCPIVPERFRNVFERMVAKSPDDRPSSMHELKDELAACLEGFDRTLFQQTAGELVEQVQKHKKEQAAKSSWKEGIKHADSASTAADTDDGTRGRAGDTDADRTLLPAGDDPQTSRIRSVTITMPRSRVLWGLSTTAILVTGMVLFPDWSPPDPVATIVDVVDVVDEPPRRVAEVPNDPHDEAGLLSVGGMTMQTQVIFHVPETAASPQLPAEPSAAEPAPAEEDELDAALRRMARQIGAFLTDEQTTAVTVGHFAGPDRTLSRRIENTLVSIVREQQLELVDELEANWLIGGSYALESIDDSRQVVLTVRLTGSNGFEHSSFRAQFEPPSARPATARVASVETLKPDEGMLESIEALEVYLSVFLEDVKAPAVSIGQIGGPAPLAQVYRNGLSEHLNNNGIRVVDSLDSVLHLRGEIGQNLAGKLPLISVTIHLVGRDGKKLTTIRDRYLIRRKPATLLADADPRPPARAADRPSPPPMPPAETSHETLIAAIDELAARTKTFSTQQNAAAISVGPFEAPTAADARTFEGALIAALQQAGVRVVDAGRASWQLRGSLSIDTTGNSPTATVEATIVENEK